MEKCEKCNATAAYLVNKKIPLCQRHYYEIMNSSLFAGKVKVNTVKFLR
jgi:hypothetical protein